MTTRKDIEFKVGRRSSDGTVRLSTHLPHLLTLSVSYKGERAASVVMTREQVRQLQNALTELESGIEPMGITGRQWDGQERRAIEIAPSSE